MLADRLAPIDADAHAGGVGDLSLKSEGQTLAQV